jgi:hypothetical protein
MKNLKKVGFKVANIQTLRENEREGAGLMLGFANLARI